ncbi:MAG TPA: endolytic transglycosylase MltG [Actinomycetota bacterium]|nr:endolytic transglycosylase MltG [Actinomycetota bacterium]
MVQAPPRRSNPRPPRRRRRRGLVILLSLIVVLVGAAVAIGGYYQWAIGASGPQKPVVLIIPPGATGSDVADLLKDKGIIRNTTAFKLFARFRGFSSGFEAGKYDLKTNLSVQDVIDILKEGPIVESVRATFPEGLTVDQMADRAHQQLGIKASAFAKLAKSGDFSLDPYLPEGTKTVEGFLFPSTYDFLKDVDAKGAIDRMLQEFKTQAAKLPWQNAKALHVTPYEVVVIASMIEREARVQADRPKIAAVIYNRLKIDMPLGIDATVRYAVDKPTGPLTQSDLHVDSPYNTRQVAGLPPTPIASPGLASLQAALSPAKADYLYFLVVDPSTGRHEFTDSYQEFLELKRQAQGA